jgi:hypothetical protein
VWNGKDCDSVSEGEPVLQGDILKRFRNGSSDSIFVVITADCDIGLPLISVPKVPVGFFGNPRGRSEFL